LCGGDFAEDYFVTGTSNHTVVAHFIIHLNSVKRAVGWTTTCILSALVCLFSLSQWAGTGGAGISITIWIVPTLLGLTMSLFAGGFALSSWLGLLRTAVSVEFGDQVTVNFLRRTLRLNWSEIQKIEFVASEDEEILGEGMPMVAALALISPETATRTVRSVYAVVRHVDGTMLVTIPFASDVNGKNYRLEYAFRRYLSQRYAGHVVEQLGGRITWDGATIRKIAFAPPGPNDAELLKLATTLEMFPDLEEMDLSGTRVTNRGLQSLLQLKKLKRVVAANTQVGIANLAAFEKELAHRQRYGNFGFLQEQ
jgi:hypothetical protein